MFEGLKHIKYVERYTSSQDAIRIQAILVLHLAHLKAICQQ